MNSHFVTVFEIGSRPINWQPMLLCVMVCIAAVAIVIWKWRSEERTEYLLVGTMFCFVAFVVGLGLLSWIYLRDTRRHPGPPRRARFYNRRTGVGLCAHAVQW